jgi:hypothetical protein
MVFFSRALTRSVSTLLVLSCVGFARSATAKTKLSLDLDRAISENVPGGDGGFGGGIRLGNQWKFLLLTLTPEFGASYQAFEGASDADAFRFVAGGRLGLGFILEPSVFAHAGLGHFGYEYLGADVSQTSLAYDVGAALDLTALPVLDIGAHATVAGIAGDDSTEALSWVAIGAHVGFNF